MEFIIYCDAPDQSRRTYTLYWTIVNIKLGKSDPAMTNKKLRNFNHLGVTLSELLEQQIGNFDVRCWRTERNTQINRPSAYGGRRTDPFVNSHWWASHLPQPLLKIWKQTGNYWQDSTTDAYRPGWLAIGMPGQAPLPYYRQGSIEQVLINLIRNTAKNDATDIRLSTGLSLRTSVYMIATMGRESSGVKCSNVFSYRFITKTTGSVSDWPSHDKSCTCITALSLLRPETGKVAVPSPSCFALYGGQPSAP